ncbi:recombination mediator RecR [Kiloniella laminariae]|uniref:Recombination protein RecR n=1 Tax=Kiloniella laminariae TaxID=454162 RepID=A0ABT4LKH4_9PROT|nr:recombination mediator RecR [Kiloniella laminariae]MCZ4281586.1 recombination mediator RecR [Kiloniella laminariae]
MAKSEIDRLAQLLSRLPGLGPRSARRVVLHLMKKRESLMLPLAKAMMEAASSITNCTICGNLDSENPCGICQHPNRDDSKICVVEDVGDLWALERSGAFKGRYHVLGGTLSALDGRGPAQLNINSLLDRASSEQVQEIILALSATVDGQTTVHYLSECLAGHEVEISKLAHGVPVGGSLDYLDDGTLTAALKSRRSTR